MSLTKASYSMITGAPINALDFGVVAGGVTNTGTAMQAALTAAGGNSIVIPPGSYNIGTTALSVPAGTTVFAYGATLTWTGDVVGVTFAPSATLQSRWFGGKLVGSGYTPQTSTCKAMFCEGTAATYSLGPEVQDVEITLWKFYGINFSFTFNARVLNCNIHGINYAGVAGLSCNNMKVDGNYIGQLTAGPGQDAYGCFIDRSEGTLEQYPLSTNCSMSNNIVEDVPYWHGLDTHGGQHFVFEGNIIRNCKRGINVTSSDNGSNVSIWAPKHCIVSNNTISCYYTGNAINLNGAFDGSTHVDYARGCIIEGNTIYGGGEDGGSPYEGAIRLRGTDGCKVSNNILERPAAAGISIYFDNLGIDVSGNTISNVGDSANSSVSCISMNGNNNTGFINGNTFNYDSAWATYNSVFAFSMSSGRTGCNLTIGPSTFIGIDANHLNLSFASPDGVEASQAQTESGSTSLSLGTVNIGFKKRFPSTPAVYLTNVGDLNPIRVSSVSTTGCTVVGTGSTSFNWLATTQ
jgi:parallel beta-helix repeat protein